MSYVKKESPSILPFQFKNILVDSIYEKMKNLLYVENKKWKELNLNNNNLKENDELEIQFSNFVYKTTYKNWRDNFAFLNNGEMNEGVPLRFMYYVDNQSDITDFSNQYGDLITNSYTHAKEIAFNNELFILRKAYEVYDINGRKYFSRESEKNIVNDLKRQVILESKYISKKESLNLKDQQNNYENLITDGKYTIFKFKASNGKTMYFKDYQSALEIYKNQISLIGGIVQEQRYTNLYSTIIDGNVKNYNWDNTTDLNKLSNQIYNDIHH